MGKDLIKLYLLLKGTVLSAKSNMGVRQNARKSPVTKKKPVKTIKVGKKNKGSWRTQTPYLETGAFESLSPVVVVSDITNIIEPDENLSPATVYEKHQWKPIVRSTVESEESVSTINSLLASPIGQITGSIDSDVDMENNPKSVNDGFSYTPSAIFRRLFGGIFSSAKETRDDSLTLDVSSIRVNEERYEVVHVFPNPDSALAHEGLMIRCRQRLMLKSDHNLDSGETMLIPASIEVKDMPTEEKVVLLRRVLSPRRLDLNQRTSIEKASMRPDLWIFASYDKCKQKFSKELCDYFDSRMIHPIQVTEKSFETPGRSVLDIPVETPIQGVEHLLGNENSIDAPLRNRAEKEFDRSAPCGITPVGFVTPDIIDNKTQDLCVEFSNKR